MSFFRPPSLLSDRAATRDLGPPPPDEGVGRDVDGRGHLPPSPRSLSRDFGRGGIVLLRVLYYCLLMCVSFLSRGGNGIYIVLLLNKARSLADVSYASWRLVLMLVVDTHWRGVI